MADKKDSKFPSSPSLGAFELIVILILIIGGAVPAINWISSFYTARAPFFGALPYNLINIYSRYVIFSFFLSIILFILIIIYSIKERKIWQKIMSKVLPPKGSVQKNLKDFAIENPKWKLVLEHINSDDSNKCKLAILEADIILSEVLDSLNLQGEGVGEKLKSLEKSGFGHIEEAWEAHKIRNAIAHQGSDFLLTQREAKRVISLFESVFEEFKII